MTDPIQHIEALFHTYGEVPYDDARHESVSALAHALQCAQLAEWADADVSLVAAALLHDIGHFIVSSALRDDEDDAHEHRAVPFLLSAFGPAVAEPVRLHVAAKRYLVAVQPDYAATLSPASQHSLSLQGGPMTAAERDAFDALPFARHALSLRRWDDMAKVPGKATPPLGYYLVLLEQLREERLRGPRTDIGAMGVV